MRVRAEPEQRRGQLLSRHLEQQTHPEAGVVVGVRRRGATATRRVAVDRLRRRRPGQRLGGRPLPPADHPPSGHALASHPSPRRPAAVGRRRVLRHDVARIVKRRATTLGLDRGGGEGGEEGEGGEGGEEEGEGGGAAGGGRQGGRHALLLFGLQHVLQKHDKRHK